MNQTDLFRRTMQVCFVVTLVAALVGFFLGMDPAKLGPVIGWVTGALAVGEASNVGKRATFKAEAMSYGDGS